ncbi:hypothetical protein GSI_00842 [Ganoderma sinense ZZ0214-1]|uniref:Bromo domain-containing protein n=1 Tax=Ganoderma sinense ZZ0214-1 TaxID=1077348 RepID=A0A2G8STR2_9APHY|nr:hypothetical protein GSI_00842 [Ganoderma sinense ZZ0214-1]
MASGVKTRRATSSPELDLSNLNNVERLIFAQAVHEFGATAWQEVAKLLSKHPMISQPKGSITPQSCSALYQHLMEEAGFEWSNADAVPRSEKHLRLAQRYYVARVAELRELIASEEAKFKKLVVEIDEIRSGAWDDRILVSLGVEPEKPEQEPPGQEVVTEPQVTETPQVQQLEEETMVQEEEEAVLEVAMEEEEELPAADQSTETAVGLPSVPEVEEREERSDNEAVNELIGDFSSDRPVGDAQDERGLAPDEPPVVEPQEDEEMQVDEAPVKQEQEEDIPPDDRPVQGPVEEITRAEGEVEGEAEGEGEAEAEAEVDAEPEVEAEAKIEVEAEVEAEIEPEIEPEIEAEVTNAGVEELLEHEPKPEPEPDPEPSPELISSSRAEGKRKASDADTMMLDAHREKKRPREESEPADEEEGVPKTRRRERAGVSDKRFQNMIGMLHSQISAHRYGNIFHNPIKKSEAPDYHDIVKRPMDLKTIKSRVKDGLVSTSLEFQRDIFLMFANAMMYNRPGSEIYNMAEEMMMSSEREINAFRQTEGFHRM